MRAIKLAINAVPLAPGGGLVVLLGYLEAWKNIGAPLDIVVFASRQFVIDAIKEVRPDIEVIPFAYGKPSWAHYLLQQTVLGRTIMKHRPDVVMNTNMSAPNCSVPQIVHHQNLYRWLYRTPWAWVKQRKFAEIVKDVSAHRSYHSSACNVFISEYMKKTAQEVAGGLGTKDCVIYNSLPDDLTDQRKDCPNNSIERFQLLAIQDIQPHKDNETLLRVLHSLIQERPEIHWVLNIAGSGNWDPVKKRASELGIDDRVNFLGYVSRAQLTMLFERSLCLVFTSILEAFGNPPLEAMAAGCPVVACDCTAIPEVVGEAGVLVAPGNIGAFATAIQSFYDDETFRQEYIGRGLERVKRFSISESATSMLRVIENVSQH